MSANKCGRCENCTKMYKILYTNNKAPYFYGGLTVTRMFVCLVDLFVCLLICLLVGLFIGLEHLHVSVFSVFWLHGPLFLSWCTLIGGELGLADQVTKMCSHQNL